MKYRPLTSGVIEMTGTELILEARDIHAWYGSSHVLHGIALQIARGETVGLLGRNGMGKSTLIRTLLGHVPQRDGHIAFFGQDLSRGKPHEVARLGVAYVPEGRGIFPNLSVRENLVMAARPGRDGRSNWPYEQVLDTFPRLKERLTNLGAQLSGGGQRGRGGGGEEGRGGAGRGGGRRGRQPGAGGLPGRLRPVEVCRGPPARSQSPGMCGGCSCTGLADFLRRRMLIISTTSENAIAK